MPLNHPPWWKTTVTGGLVLIAGRAEYLDGKGPEPAPDKQSGPRPTRAFYSYFRCGECGDTSRLLSRGYEP